MSKGRGPRPQLQASYSVPEGISSGVCGCGGGACMRAWIYRMFLMQVFLYRLFRESVESPRKIKMDVVRRAFPQSVISESVIRKVLKLCADFKREGRGVVWFPGIS